MTDQEKFLDPGGIGRDTLNRFTIHKNTNRLRPVPMEVPYDLGSYVRVLRMASTPSWTEFSQVAKIAGAGILLVGLLGFLIFVVMQLIPGGVSAAASGGA